MLVDALEAPLLRYATRILGNATHSEDVVQEAFVKFAKAWRGDFAVSAEASAWLYRAVHNEAVDLIRAEERRRRLHREHGDEAFSHSGNQFSDGKGDIGDEAAAAAAALDALSPRERQAVVLKIYEGKRYKEIADIMGVSVDNVGVTLHGAMRKLASMLDRKDRS